MVFIVKHLSYNDYCIVGMFRRVKVSILKEKIFVGFISICLFCSISNTGCHLLTS